MLRFRVKELHEFSTQRVGTYGYPTTSSEPETLKGVSLALEAIPSEHVPGSCKPPELMLRVTQAEAEGLKVGAWYKLVECPPPGEPSPCQ